ncbi:MAG: polysaccharide biosynthesis tyrosine autokinase [Acidobacteria bacterium]|nr:polysaccharide biosynthesis tyrosine autokinase [Acidobacteriota bacterium]
MSDETNKPADRPQLPPDESLYIRPSAAPQITSLDQLYSYNNYYSSAGNEGFNYRDIWRKIRKRKWLILTIVFIATTIVSIESFRTKSLYQASAKVAFNQENTVIKAGDLILQSDDSGRIRTELLLLKTYPLLEDVVVRLQLDKNPRFLDIGDRKTVPEAIETIFSKFGSRQSATPEIPQMEPLTIEPNLQAARSEEEVARLAPFVGILQSNLQVEQIIDTNAIELRFVHTNPAIASTVANGVARVFVENSFNNKTEKFTNSANWLDRTTRGLLAQVQQAEQSLANYSSSHDIFSTDENNNLTAEKLASIYSQALKAETDRILKQSVYEEVVKGRVAQLPEAFSDTRTSQYQTDLSKLQLKVAELNARYGPENPKVVEVQQQIKELQTLIGGNVKSLEEKLRADYERAVRDETLIKQSLDRAKSEAAQQNQAAIQFNILKQNVETTKSLYNDFLQKTNQANIQRAEQYSDLRIIDPARVPGAPTGPNRLRSIFLGIMLSLVAGIGLALLIEFMDNTVKSIEDVARATQLPTLALIPTMKANSVRVLSAKKKAELREVQNKRITDKLTEISGIAPRTLHPKDNRLATLDGLSSVVEAYRMLRTSVLLSTAGMPPRTILVTSSQPSEGKTTTAVNTAISLAQLGARVLLIDADLRRPAVHKTFKLQHTRGLSSYLSGSGNIDDLIVKLTIPNLSVLTSGPIPPNPAELISSERMRDMLRSLAESYEHIIIDSPPLIHVTDPVILSTMVDGSILVVQAGRSTREMLRRAKQELVGVGAKIFGVVLNNVDVKKEGYDEYYYQRYYSSYNESHKGAKAG